MSWQRKRDQAAEDLVMTARSVGPATEAAAWALLGSRPGATMLRRVRQGLYDTLMGEERTPSDQSRSDTTHAMLVPGRLARWGDVEGAARREGWGRGYAEAAVLLPGEARAVRAILRGKTPRGDGPWRRRA